MVTEKLSEAQKNVMKWLGKRWSAHIKHGDVWGINGDAVTCTTSTLTALEKKGLVERESPHSWKATDKGRRLTADMNL